MTTSRLKKQGFANYHRKLLFCVFAIAIGSYLFFAPDLCKLSHIAILCAQIAGSLLIFTGILGRVLATISIGGHKDSTIMQTELYSICRNPLYFASFLIALGVGLLAGRLDFLFLAAGAYLAIFYPMMRNEANYLRGNFQEFAEYEKRVPLFLPNFSLWQERKRFEISFKLVKRTLLDASLALLAIPVMILVREFFQQ
jgi:protein-S-isoprenylcysteine O-methyltransferase Ste14